MAFQLEIARSLYEAMVAQAVAELPNECCGMLAGLPLSEGLSTARVVERYPLVNALASPVAFESEPRNLLAAHKDMRFRGLEPLAIYHSHPTSPPVPSKTDLAQNYWPGVINLIISLRGGTAEVRGWWLDAEGFREGAWRVV